MTETGVRTQQSRTCPECGARRPINATRCPVCGTPTARTAARTTPARNATEQDAERQAEKQAESQAERPAESDTAPPATAPRREASGRPQLNPRAETGKGRGPGPAGGSRPTPSPLDRLRKLNGLGALRRLVSLAALVIILLALGYAILPFKTGRTNCSPAVVQVFDRQRLTPPSTPGGPPGPPITAGPAAPAGTTPVATPKGVLRPCTEGAKRRLYDAGPIIALALIGSAGARRALA